jgi:hypothetical protein
VHRAFDRRELCDADGIPHTVCFDIDWIDASGCGRNDKPKIASANADKWRNRSALAVAVYADAVGIDFGLRPKEPDASSHHTATAKPRPSPANRRTA